MVVSSHALKSVVVQIQKYREQLQDIENDKAMAATKPQVKLQGTQVLSSSRCVLQPKVQSRYWTAEEHHQFLIGT